MLNVFRIIIIAGFVALLAWAVWYQYIREKFPELPVSETAGVLVIDTHVFRGYVDYAA